MTSDHPVFAQQNGSAFAAANAGSERGEWRCAACSGEWTIGVQLLGGRFHPTCEPQPVGTIDAQEIWDG